MKLVIVPSILTEKLFRLTCSHSFRKRELYYKSEMDDGRHPFATLEYFSR